MQDKHQALSEIFKSHQSLVVIGGSWGDEGKGKIIDAVLAHYDIATRFSGGANAGHTVFTPEGKKLVSHLIPCGLAQNKICVLARGEFFNLELFLQELEDSKKVLADNIPPIYIDQQTPLWTPYHTLFEIYIEAMRGQIKIGTTNKGIGPLEGLYKLRLSPLTGYLLEEKRLKESLEVLYKTLAPCFNVLKSEKIITEEIPEVEQVYKKLLELAPRVSKFIIDGGYFLHQALLGGKRILFEGAQATGLDSHWGTYPFVSSGNSVASGASIGTGLPMQDFSSTLMVVKTLPTRVGAGPMPSEMWERDLAMAFAKEHGELFVKSTERDNFLAQNLEKINQGKASSSDMAQYFQVLGDERGATTGRGRSLGFLDIPWLLYAIRINKPKWLALTRFDMLSGIKSIPVVVGYKYGGKVLARGEIVAPWNLDKVEVIKEDWPCFTEDILGIESQQDLPEGATAFLNKLEQLLTVPILLVGTGPGRDALIVRSP